MNSSCTNLWQGDVIETSAQFFSVFGPENIGRFSPDFRVAILSQTCDVVQKSKLRCIVAPVLNQNKGQLSNARKGRSPLHLYLKNESSAPQECVVDIEYATSVPKSMLAGNKILARYVTRQSSQGSKAVAFRVGRAFSRFAFPDEIFPFFQKFRERAQKGAGSNGNFGRVIDLIEDIRVKSDQWGNPGRNLVVYMVVSSRILSNQDDLEPDWQTQQTRFKGAKASEIVSHSTNLDRICELILENQDEAPAHMVQLWALFGAKIRTELFGSNDPQVNTLEVEVLNDDEMTYRNYIDSESLDLEVLSDSTAESK